MGPADTGEQACSSPAYVCVCMSKLSYTCMYTHTLVPPPSYLSPSYLSLLSPISSPPPPPCRLAPSSLLLTPYSLLFPLLIPSSSPFSPCAVLENTWVYIASTAILTNLIWWHLVAAMGPWGSGTCDRRDITYRSSKHTKALVLERAALSYSSLTPLPYIRVFVTRKVEYSLCAFPRTSLHVYVHVHLRWVWLAVSYPDGDFAIWVWGQSRDSQHQDNTTCVNYLLK